MSGPEAIVSVAGPSAQTISKLWSAYAGPKTQTQDYLRAQMMPMQNLIWARLLNTMGASRPVSEHVGQIPGIVPADVYRPNRPTLR